MKKSYIRFDWAMKRLLRDKANFAVLEGLITTLLGEKMTIQKLLESESNQEDEDDKYNRVDILAENDKGEIFIIEIQNNNEYAYFQRMLLNELVYLVFPGPPLGGLPFLRPFLGQADIHDPGLFC